MSQTNRMSKRAQLVTSSMLWAAWADALGFISELTDTAGLRRRLGGVEELTVPVAWTRRVGGKFGVSAELPVGCYSDDTQLRLATARAISARGFDVEAFTAVELPLWPAYALGGGRASKSAAVGFTKPDTPWFANFYDGWVNAGGNGAAMRIQPHVWAAAPSSTPDYLRDVLINTITTHGHPRALVGAVLHAVALNETLTNAAVPDPRDWPSLVDITDRAFDLLYDNDMVATVWVPAWEKATNSSLRDAWRETITEVDDLLKVAIEHKPDYAVDDPNDGAAYGGLCDRLGLHDDATRGSGTATVVAALWLAAAYRGLPLQCAVVPSRALGTDTDTIATMAASLVGATMFFGTQLPTEVQDREYLIAQAQRLAAIAEGAPVEPTNYPDLLTWQPPRSQLDAVGLVDRELALAGLGMLFPQTGTEPWSSRGAQWRWFESDFGATFLLKHRELRHMKELPDGNRPLRRIRYRASLRHATERDVHAGQLPLLDTPIVQTAQEYVETGSSTLGRGAAEPEPHATVDVDQMLAWVARNEFSDKSVGYAVRRIADLGSVEQLIAFTTALRRATRRSS